MLSHFFQYICECVFFFQHKLRWKRRRSGNFVALMPVPHNNRTAASKRFANVDVSNKHFKIFCSCIIKYILICEHIRLGSLRMKRVLQNVLFLCNLDKATLMALHTRGVARGARGTQVPRCRVTVGALNHCGGAEKSQQCHKYFHQYSTFAS